MGFHRGFQYSGTKYFGHQQAAHANRLTIVVDGRGYTSSRELSPSSPYISELHSTIATERSHTRMRLHTSVMSLGPLHSYKGAPPDMLSGGGRQILASYTEFSHQGNFLDAACRLIDTLPHQSPAIGSGRKALQGGRKKARGRRRGSTGGATDAVVGSGTEEKAERIRHHSGDHVFYLYMTTTLCLLCVTDGLPIDEEVFEYLALVAREVSAAVAPLRKADAEKVRRAASHALIDSMNTWTSKVNAGSYRRSQSPTTFRSSTPVCGQPGTPSSPDAGERYTLELCLVEAVRRLRIERVEKSTSRQKGNAIDEGGGADTARSPAALPSPLQLVTPAARRPRPSPRGPLSPGPRVGVAADGGSSPRSDSTPVTSASVLPTECDEVSPSRPKSFPNGFARHAQFKGFHASEETSSFSPVSSMASVGQGNAGKSTPTPVLVDLEFDVNEASAPEGERDTSPAGRGAMAVCTKSVSLPSISSERMPNLMKSLKESRGPVVSLDLPRRERLCGDLGMERSHSMNTTSRAWNNSPSPSTVVGPEIVRAATPPAPASLLPRPLPLHPTPPMADPSMVGGHNPLPSGPSGPFPGYGSPGVPLHPPPPSQQQQQQQQQWHSIPTQQAAPAYGPETQMGIGVIPRIGSAPPGCTLGLTGSTWVQKAGVGGSTASPPAVATTVAGGISSLDASAMVVHPAAQQMQTWATSENVPVPLAVVAPIAATRTTTVAEERRRRRRQEGFAGGEKGVARASLDEQSTEFRRSSSGGKLSSSSGRRLSNGVGSGRRTLGSGSVGGGAGGVGHGAGMPQSGALSPGSSANGGVGGLMASMGPYREGAISPHSLSSASFSPNGSPFGHSKGTRRSLTPPPLQGERRPASAVGGMGSSIDPSRRYPSGVEGRGGRSESVPPRLRSSSGSLLEVEIGELSAGVGGGEPRVSEDGKSPKLGILLPLDYSGMSTTETDSATGDAPLLRDFDGMARNALKAQVEVSKSDDDLLAVLTKFRDTLLSIPLPPPAAVDYEQALKDARRESIELNGRLFEGNVEELLTTLRGLMGPLVVGDESLMRTVCQDIVRASSRTSSGGDTYSVISTLLSRPMEGDILTPSGAESAPIEISVDASKGEVVITVENSFLLRRNAMDETGKVARRPTGEKGTLKAKMVRARGQLDEFVEQTAEQFRKIKARREGWGGPGWSLEGPSTKPDRGSSEESAADEPAGIPLSGKMEVYLRLLDGSSKRRLKITCLIVERCPPECILLGAGTNGANGTYELAGFRNGGPIYTKGNNDVTISKECLGDREGWIIGRPPNRVLYGQPGDMDLPPELHWSLLNGGSGQNPPPTLMMHSQRRAKENMIDIREMPTPRQHWAIGPNVTFLDDKDHDLVSSVSSARSPTPATPPK